MIFVFSWFFWFFLIVLIFLWFFPSQKGAIWKGAFFPLPISTCITFRSVAVVLLIPSSRRQRWNHGAPDHHADALNPREFTRCLSIMFKSPVNSEGVGASRAKTLWGHRALKQCVQKPMSVWGFWESCSKALWIQKAFEQRVQKP